MNGTSWKIEVVTVPVSDVDRAWDFYVERIGFEVDIDHSVDSDVRLVQLTPPGSACSIHLGTNNVAMKPGTMDGLFLVVQDVREAREYLTGRGLAVGELLIFEDGAYRAVQDGDDLDYVGCCFFRDPDGNGWCVQQIPDRA